MCTTYMQVTHEAAVSRAAEVLTGQKVSHKAAVPVVQTEAALVDVTMTVLVMTCWY